MSRCVWLLRHGDTEWTEAGRHTGLHEVPLSERGRAQAKAAGRLLAGRRFAAVLVSPQSRALETCRLAGFGDAAELHDDLVEWDYGEYDGLTDGETQRRHPGWDLFLHGAPGGESAARIATRVDRTIAYLREQRGPCLVVGHGKSLRALAARWLGCEVALGRVLPMDPAAIGVLDREQHTPLLRLWNYGGAPPP